MFRFPFEKYCHSCKFVHGFTCIKNAKAAHFDEKTGNGPTNITGMPTPETSRYIMPHVCICPNVEIQCKVCGFSETKPRLDSFGFECVLCTKKAVPQLD